MSELGKACQHKITIEPSHNKGFHVRIGCAILTFHTKDALIAALERYLRDPEQWEKEYNKVCQSDVVGEATNAEAPEPRRPQGSPSARARTIG